jgi:hypothetical protein
MKYFPNELCGATDQSAMRAQFGPSGPLIALDNPTVGLSGPRSVLS